MTTMPKRAMVLAAGLGLRLRPITETLPKPLVEVGGATLLDHAIDTLARAGVETCVVNTHYRAQQIVQHLAARQKPAIVLSHEETLLDTGGGTSNSLAHFGDEPFWVINSDTFWLDGIIPALQRLAQQWDAARMDALLLLHPAVAAIGYEGDGRGDYFLAADGRLRRRSGNQVAPFLFAGASLCSKALFANVPGGAFSLRLLWDRAQENDRLYGMRHDGEWFHVGTPEALDLVRNWFDRGGRSARVME